MHSSLLLPRFLLTMLIASCMPCAVCFGSEFKPEMVSSPNARLSAHVWLEAGQPLWCIKHGDTPVTLPGKLGLELLDSPLFDSLTLAEARHAQHDSTWQPIWGNRSAVRDHYQELALTLQESKSPGRRYQIVVRAYDEGIALRYVVPAQAGMESVGIKKRFTEYRFPKNFPVYQNRGYQYGNAGIDQMLKSEGNVTIALDGGRFLSLTDADRRDFAQVSWEHHPKLPQTVVGTLLSPSSGTLPLATSWEVLLWGDTAGQLYEQRHLVENLNPPCELADTSWIRPGEAICQVRNARMVTDELKRLAEFASQKNIEYLEIDHSWCGAETKWTPAEIAFFEQHKSKFWDDKPEWKNNVGGNLLAAAKGWVPFRPKADTGGNYVDLDVPALCAYAKQLQPPVGICLYVRGSVLKEFGGEHPMEKVFAAYRAWGVAGVKAGFVPAGSQRNERTITEMVRCAAKHQLILCIHDAYFPSGLSRTLPNLMNIEGVAGEEAEPSIPAAQKSTHDVMLPFTRCLMGPVDYTPEIYKTSKTHAHQVALLGVYHGRPSIRGGRKQWTPGGIGGKEIEFVEKLPGLFDDYRAYTEFGRHVTVARRRGRDWFVATIGNEQKQAFTLPLDFLPGDEKYHAWIDADTPGKLSATHAQTTVDRQTKLPINLEPNGGHLLRLEPVRPGGHDPDQQGLGRLKAQGGASPPERLAAEKKQPPAAKPKDPAYAPIVDDPALPRVLIIGDSVSVGYTLALRKELEGQANLHRPGANCGSTKIGLRDLHLWLGDKKWDVIHFNWGLHDLGYRFDNDSNKDAQGRFARPDNGGHQNVPPAEYEKNLRELVGRLKKTGAKLIFATTTPVPADLSAYVKGSEAPYNEAAQRVMKELGVEVNDLWAFAQPQLETIQEQGNPHFHAKGSQVLAKEIAAKIRTALATPENADTAKAAAAKDAAASLRRVADHILKQTTRRLINRSTGETWTDSTELMPKPEISIESKFNAWFYQTWLLADGMRRTAQVLEEPRYRDYGEQNLEFLYRHLPYFQRQYSAKQKAAPIGDGVLSPIGFYFQINSLWQSGLAPLVQERYAATEDERYKPFLERVKKFIATCERFEDGLLYRKGKGAMTDDPYMTVPFLVREERFDEAIAQVLGTHSRLLDADKQLLRHLWDVKTQKPSGEFWGRGNGWTVLAHVELLAALPKDHPRRDAVLQAFVQHMQGIRACADPQGGWHQVLDHPESWLETSATGMLTYGMARGVNEGWLDDSFAETAKRGWKALQTKVTSDGDLLDVCGSTDTGDLRFYLNRPRLQGDLHGFGSYLLAGAEIVRLNSAKLQSENPRKP